jgi:hypothetical protein
VEADQIGPQRAQGGRGWADAGRWDCVKSGFIFPILVRRTIGFTTPTTMHDLVMGLCINRDEWGAAIAHGINTLGTPASMRACARAAYAHILTGSDAIMGTSSRVVANLWPSDGRTSDKARFSPWAKGASTRRFPNPFALPLGKGRTDTARSQMGIFGSGPPAGTSISNALALKASSA